MSMFYPREYQAIPPHEQTRIRHVSSGATGITRSTTNDGCVVVQFDNEPYSVICLPEKLVPDHDTAIPPFPGKVVSLTAYRQFLAIQGGRA